MSRICITIGDELGTWITDEAEKEGVSKSEIVVRIIDQYRRTGSAPQDTQLITHLREENMQLWGLVNRQALPAPRRSFWDWVRGR